MPSKIPPVQTPDERHASAGVDAASQGKPDRSVRKRLRQLLTRRLTREEVTWCYRTVLGREPESEAALQMHLDAGSLRQLVEAFLRSEEYASKRPLRRYHPIPLPAARIDTGSDPVHLAAAVAKVRATWSHLGQVRPHFSVLTNQRFLPENLPQSIEHFWASGELEAEGVVAMLSAHRLAPAGAVCVEYGCGVGRVTVGLARHFGQVHGYDISDGHLAEARARVDACALGNVQLHLCADAILEELTPCDVFYSRIVLQHNPPPLMAELVKMALSALRPGGIAIFQLPIYAEGYTFDLDAWLASPPAMDMEMHCLPQSLVFRLIAQAGCIPLEVREDDSAGDQRYISNLFIVQRPPAEECT
jgi:SAM-dependent methyltransferase